MAQGQKKETLGMNTVKWKLYTPVGQNGSCFLRPWSKEPGAKPQQKRCRQPLPLKEGNATITRGPREWIRPHLKAQVPHTTRTPEQEVSPGKHALL